VHSEMQFDDYEKDFQVGTDHGQSQQVWIFMVDSRNSEDLRDLDHLDAILWGANPHTKRGDLVLMYRTAPYSDIPYVFVAGFDPRPAGKIKPTQIT
jgi:hypothetical protein